MRAVLTRLAVSGGRNATLVPEGAKNESSQTRQDLLCWSDGAAIERCGGPKLGAGIRHLRRAAGPSCRGFDQQE